MKKSLLSLLAVAGMMIPSAAVAQTTTFDVDGVKYALLEDGSGVEVSSSTLKGDIVIPSTVKNGNVTYRVVAVGKSAFENSEATSVKLPNTVRIIKDIAFCGCDIVSIDLGTGLEELGNNVFGASQELKNLSELPAGLVKIGAQNFYMNFALTAINVSPDNKMFKSVDGVLYSKSGRTAVSYPCGKGTSYVFPEGTDSINESFFNTFQAATQITFPKSLKYIGGQAFTYCRNMTSTNDLPAGLLEIQYGAFSNCRKIVLTVPSTVKVIGNQAFNNNYLMKKVNVPGGVKEVGQNAFTSASALTELTIAEGVEILGDYAFNQCGGYKRLVIPNTVTKIGGYAFRGVTGGSLKYLELGEKVAEVGVRAFMNQKPDTIICRAVIPPAYTNTVYDMVDPGCFGSPLFVPEASIDAYKAANGWNKFTNYKPLSELGGAGISDIETDKTVAAEDFYTLSGMKVAKPEAADGNMYIVVTRYTDGSMKSAKKLNR